MNRSCTTSPIRETAPSPCAPTSGGSFEPTAPASRDTRPRGVVRRATRVAGLVASGALLAGLTIGCETTTGEDGNLLFTDTAEGSGGAIRPVALGRSNSYEIRVPGSFTLPTLQAGDSDDEGVFTVSSVSGNRVTISATGVGEARLSVTTTRDVSDRIALEVREAAGAVLRVLDGATEPRILATVRENAGLRVAPEQAFQVAHFYFVDAGGSALSGAGGTIPWTTPDDLLTAVDVSSNGYQLDITAAEEAETFTLGWSGGAAGLDIAVRPDADYHGLTLRRGASINQALSITGTTINVTGNFGGTIAIEPRDPDNRLVIGDYGYTATVEISDPSLLTIASSGSCTETAEGSDRCLRYEGISDLQLVAVTGGSNGTGTIAVTIADVTETFTVTVSGVTEAGDPDAVEPE